MEWLSELYTRIEEQKLRQERTILNLKQLFKPWPQTEPESNSISQNKVLVDGQTVGLPGNNATPELTSSEKESLLMVEKVLSKAQKARNVQKKLEEPTKSRLKGPLHTESRHGKNNSAAKNCMDGDSSGCESKENSPRLDKMAASEDKEKLGKSSETNSAHKTSAISSNSRVGSNKVKPEVTKTRTSSSNAKCNDKTERARISERPQSSSSRKKALPVHASAPFKTNPHQGTSRLQTTYRAATAKTFAKSRGASNSAKVQGKGGVSKVTASLKSVSGNLHRTSNAVTNEEVTRTACDDKMVVDSSMCDGLSEVSNKESVPHDVEEAQSKMAEMSVNASQCEADNKVQSDKIPVPQPLNEKKGFNLAKDGASLSVPGKLKKLLHHNQKLRQKLNAQKLTKKVDSPLMCDEFPVHFEHVFGNEDEKYVQVQARQARHIVHTYTKLSSLLDSLNLEKISVDTHPADIYRCKKMMEYILVTYQETEELLRNIDFGKLTTVATYSGNSEPRLPVSQPDNSHLWYTRLAPLGNTHQNGIKYASYKHLEKYMHIVYQIQLTQLQIDVMDTVARLLLPLLKSLDPSTSEFLQVLRAGYSLLTINRNHMPVVVKDTIQDESVQELSEEET